MTTEIELRELPELFEGIRKQFRQIEYREVFGEIIDDLEAAHQSHFNGQHNPAGNAWPPLAPSTVARKGHDTILFESGRLQDSLTGLTSDSVREIEQPGGASAGFAFGTSVPYAIYHQLGGGRIPQREHVGTTETGVDSMAELIADHVVESLHQ